LAARIDWVSKTIAVGSSARPALSLAWQRSSPNITLSSDDKPMETRKPPSEVEAGLTLAALADLGTRTRPGGYDLTHLQFFHREIFSDLYHGDFDWGGLRIANLLLRRIPWQPWRYDTTFCEAGVRRHGVALSGRPATAAWDPRLAAALAADGRRLEEEHVMEDLLDGLVCASSFR
jgi:hypothetical protein